VIGPIQVDILHRLRESKGGIPVDILLREYRYKQGGQRSLVSLEKAGHIRIVKGVAVFQSYPNEVEPRVTIKAYTAEQLEELDDLSRRNLLYTYKDELARYQNGAVPVNALPTGVRKSLQNLGVIKWKVLELTDLGRRLLSEILTRATAPMPTMVAK